MIDTDPPFPRGAVRSSRLTAHPAITAPQAALTSDFIDEIRAGAAKHDAYRILPFDMIDRMKRARFGAGYLPAAFRERGESFVATIVQIIDLAAADPNIAPIWHNHFLMLQRLRSNRGAAGHVDFLCGEVAAGRLLSLARTELTRAQTGGAGPFAATLLPQGADCVTSGRRFYPKGVICADYLQSAATTSEGVNTAFIVPKTRTGVQILDEWTGMGQRRIAQNRRAADAELRRFFINARTDLFLQDAGVEPEVSVVEALHRAKQYIDAGADRIYFAAKDPAYDVVAELAASIPASLTLVPPDGRNFSNWGALGVTRSSFGAETADVIYCANYSIAVEQKTWRSIKDHAVAAAPMTSSS